MKVPGIVIISVLVLLISSCHTQSADEKEFIENRLIDKETMVMILADMQITEAYIRTIKKVKTRKDSSLLYYERLFKKNHTNRSNFEESMLYYEEDLEGMEELYAQVITRLNELQAKSDEILLIMKADSIRIDSIRQLEIADSMKQIEINDSLLKLSDSAYFDNK